MRTSGVMAEEHDLNFPREPEPQSTLGRWMKQAMEARRYRDAEGRGPDPDAPPVTAADLERLVQRIAREQEPGYHIVNNEGGGGNKWDKWAMPGLVTLAVSGIIGNVVQSMVVAGLRQEVTDMRAELTDLKKLVEPRYRGG